MQWYGDVITPALQTFFCMFDICNSDLISASLAETPFELQTSSGGPVFPLLVDIQERVMQNVKTGPLFRAPQMCKRPNVSVSIISSLRPRDVQNRF